jgi:hypothetical protein
VSPPAISCPYNGGPYPERTTNRHAGAGLRSSAQEGFWAGQSRLASTLPRLAGALATRLLVSFTAFRVFGRNNTTKLASALSPKHSNMPQTFLQLPHSMGEAAAIDSQRFLSRALPTETRRLCWPLLAKRPG